MKLTARGWLRPAGRVAVCAVTIWLAGMAAADAQAVSTTTVQGTVYQANGQPAGGTLVVNWPTFTTAAGQLISAGQTTVTVGADGYVSVNLAPNQGATPAGEYYTAVFYKSDGTVSTQYWTVPAAAQASLAEVQAQVMPSAQAVQAVSKAYVDQTVSQALGSQLSASGGNLTGPLLLSGDPSQPLQAADKHYVDSSFSAALPLSGGTITGPASFNAAVTFGSSVTASSGMSFTGTGAAQTLTNLLPGAASDSANGMTLQGTSAPNAIAPKVSPMADIRANGAKIDGVTDIGPALAASMAQCNVANGNACTVLVPSGGPNGAYWANGTDGVSLASGVTLILQGNLNLQTTLVTPNVNVNIIGSDGGNDPVQFASPNQTASITVPSADHGVLGTAVSTPDGTPRVVTFTPSTMAGLYANTWITIAGPLTCSITSLTRVNNLVTATLSSSCHIPPGVPVIVAGVADSSFNGSHIGTGFGPFTMLSSDYVKNTMTWKQSGQVDATSTGGTVTGFNEDTVENVQLSSCTSTTCTATFYRSHAATDLWGVDGVAMDAGAGGSHSQLLKNIAIRAPGTALDTGGFNSQFSYISASSTGQCTYQYYNFPVSALASSFMRFDSDAFNNFCGPWSIHEWNQYNYGFAAAGPLYINNSFLLRGVKLDHGGSDVYITNSTLDQNFAAISFDPNYFWNGNANNLVLNNDIFNDNPDGFPTVAIYQTVPVATNSPAGSALVNISKIWGAMQATVNDNFPQAGGPGGTSLKNDTRLPNSITTPKGIVGTYNDGRIIDGEIRGAGANFSPAVVPFATVNVNTSPASWTGACNVATGVLGPDGTANAGALTQNFSDEEIFGSLGSLTPAVGDVILFGAWVYSPTPGAAATSQGLGANVLVDNNSSTHFSFNYVSPGGFRTVSGLDAGIINDWWHPVVGIATVTSADGTSGQTVRLGGGCDTVKTIDYFDPWMMYVPASAGIPLAELERWRTQLMHAYVPPSAAAGTLAADPNLPLTSGQNQLLPANPLPIGSFTNFAGSGSPSDTCSGTSGFLGVTENNSSNALYKCIYNGSSYLWQQLSTGSASVPAVPGWLLWQGDGSGGAFSCTTGTCDMRGENWYSSVTISSGATAFLNNHGGAYFGGPLTIRSTGTCTIAGTLSASPNASASGNNGNSFGGGSGGGGGGGTAAGSAGSNSGNSTTVGAAGATSGGTGGNATAGDARDYNFLIAGSGFTATNFNLMYGGAKGGNGGSTGATGGFGGGGIVLDCATINFTGTIDVSGAAGGAAAANNTGAGGGGGGGFVIMRSQNMTNSGTINVSGGSGGSCGAFTGCGPGGNGRAGWSEVFTQ